ncbi:hypothetical protein CPC08DRAFT_771101 [Agrocybe pediades]|nr:hypothetical protein CPC08DRAFT_771101 [Agrocybe pediades]
MCLPVPPPMPLSAAAKILGRAFPKWQPRRPCASTTANPIAIAIAIAIAAIAIANAKVDANANAVSCNHPCLGHRASPTPAYTRPPPSPPPPSSPAGDGTKPNARKTRRVKRGNRGRPRWESEARQARGDG